jgi:hypothetical protein
VIKVFLMKKGVDLVQDLENSAPSQAPKHQLLPWMNLYQWIHCFESKIPKQNLRIKREEVPWNSKLMTGEERDEDAQEWVLLIFSHVSRYLKEISPVVVEIQMAKAKEDRSGEERASPKSMKRSSSIKRMN